MLGMVPPLAAAGRSLMSQVPAGMGIEVLSEDGNFVVRAHVPGIARDDIDVSVEDDVLTVRATRQEAKEERKEDYWYSEVRKGSFSRSIRLPEGLDASGLKADLADGVLTLRAPLPADGMPPAVVRIPIGGGEDSPASGS